MVYNVLILVGMAYDLISEVLLLLDFLFIYFGLQNIV